MAVRALLHYALDIPDLSVGGRFYRNFGLADKSTRDETVQLRPTQLPRESVLLYPGPKKRLHHLAFGAPGDEYAQVQEAIQCAGVREVDPPVGGLDGGMWIRDPDGNLLNIRDEGPLTPPADPPLTLNSPGHPARQAVRGCPEADLIVQPRRLGHVLLFTPDVDRQLAFYTQVLGLK
jgi:catechol 2,3-dioxygenase-like lactoylglutathione lyase family enzyme